MKKSEAKKRRKKDFLIKSTIISSRIRNKDRITWKPGTHSLFLSLLFKSRLPNPYRLYFYDRDRIMNHDKPTSLYSWSILVLFSIWIWGSGLFVLWWGGDVRRDGTLTSLALAQQLKPRDTPNSIIPHTHSKNLSKLSNKSLYISYLSIIHYKTSLLLLCCYGEKWKLLYLHNTHTHTNTFSFLIYLLHYYFHTLGSASLFSFPFFLISLSTIIKHCVLHWKLNWEIGIVCGEWSEADSPRKESVWFLGCNRVTFRI